MANRAHNNFFLDDPEEEFDREEAKYFEQEPISKENIMHRRDDSLLYKEYHKRCVQACVDLMGEEVRWFFDHECSYEEEFAKDEAPEQVALDNRDAMES